MYPNETQIDFAVKLRYRSITTPCKVTIKDGLATINLGDTAFGVDSGQLALFYMGEKVIGSSWIKEKK